MRSNFAHCVLSRPSLPITRVLPPPPPPGAGPGGCVVGLHVHTRRPRHRRHAAAAKRPWFTTVGAFGRLQASRGCARRVSCACEQALACSIRCGHTCLVTYGVRACCSSIQWMLMQHHACFRHLLGMRRCRELHGLVVWELHSKSSPLVTVSSRRLQQCSGDSSRSAYHRVKLSSLNDSSTRKAGLLASMGFEMNLEDDDDGSPHTSSPPSPPRDDGHRCDETQVVVMVAADRGSLSQSLSSSSPAATLLASTASWQTWNVDVAWAYTSSSGRLARLRHGAVPFVAQYLGTFSSPPVHAMRIQGASDQTNKERAVDVCCRCLTIFLDQRFGGAQSVARLRDDLVYST